MKFQVAPEVAEAAASPARDSQGGERENAWPQREKGGRRVGDQLTRLV